MTLVELIALKAMMKLTKEEYLAQRAPIPSRMLSQELEQQIINLPYSDREYKSQEVVKMNKVRIQYGKRIIHDGDWHSIEVDMNKRPINPTDKLRAIIGEGNVDGSNSHERILKALEFYGIYDNKVVLWGTGTPLREFLWSEDMADASVHVLLNVDFKDIIGIEKYSSVFYGAKVDGAVDRNNSEGRGGAIPSLGEIRNCHINVGTGKELTIRELSELVVKAVGFEGEVEFDASKPDGTPRKLISVDKLHSLGWTHKVEIEDGVQKLFEWYKNSLKD